MSGLKLFPDHLVEQWLPTPRKHKPLGLAETSKSLSYIFLTEKLPIVTIKLDDIYIFGLLFRSEIKFCVVAFFADSLNMRKSDAWKNCSVTL